ncbi:hypothetical protein EVAR_66466_1 [Eumeta japonica]|uniref:Uncharacterized protein n=1 Tax=Eumeta variegata TaxID=151549 RepID=A0A4C1SH41_EUMVA|nr:hypothetical protein EVAR_66466_1 [Eumeta japonica]
MGFTTPAPKYVVPVSYAAGHSQRMCSAVACPSLQILRNIIAQFPQFLEMRVCISSALITFLRKHSLAQSHGVDLRLEYCAVFPLQPPLEVRSNYSSACTAILQFGAICKPELGTLFYNHVIISPGFPVTNDHFKVPRE